MAKSGSFTGTTANEFITPTISWSVEQSIAENKSTVTATLSYYKSSASTAATAGYWYGSITIDGVTQEFGGTHITLEPGGSSVSVATYTRTISHNPDGSKSISISASGSISETTLTSTNISKGITLDTIPRTSSISCTSANIESAPIITISRASSSFTHTVIYSFGTLSGTIATKTSATTINNWIIPASFYSQIPNAKDGWGTLSCTTYSGGTEIGTDDCTFYVGTDETKCKPNIAASVVDKNDSTVTLTGNRSTLVRYRSTALCTLDATTNKSAGSIKEKTINNTAISGNTLEIPNVGTNVFDFYAKDSREYFNTAKLIKSGANWIEYIPLTNDATIQRDDPTSGNATLTIEGNYYNGGFGAVSNILVVKYRQGSGDYVSVTPTISGNRYKATVALTGLDYTKSFNYEVVVTDKIDYIPKNLTLQKGIPVFDWGENDFRFNVPVIFSDGATRTIHGGFDGDANTITFDAVLRTMDGATNCPSNNGFLLAFAIAGGDCVVQFGCDYSGALVKMRTYWYGRWYDWKSIN